ncbi:MAG: DUF1501 domain-containing protein [Bryobacteraceae bacterium]
MRFLQQRNRLTRRELIAGAAAAPFAVLARRGDAQISVQNVRAANTARACIFINLRGAPSHLDTFDVKDAPWNPAGADIRPTAAGFLLSRAVFPEMFKLAGDMVILRSVTSWEAAHDRGQFYLQTAHPSNPAFAAETPGIGAIIGLERASAGPLPPFLAFNNQTPQGATFLGGRFDPLTPGVNRAGIGTLQHNFYGAQSQPRFEQKYKLLRALDEPVRTNYPDEVMSAHAAYYDSARSLMYNSAIASVFQYTADDEGRYGNTPVGRGAIVARNAVRAKNGAVFITVVQDGWDTHQNMWDRTYTPNIYQLGGDLDRAAGALVTDLKTSGDFAQTLIVIMGEFGRTPGPLNARLGRDHHKDAMSVVMLGGGIRGGRVIGATDANGAKVVEPGWSANRSIYMEDIAATVYSALGINWTKSIIDTPSGRRFEYIPYADQGQYLPVAEVFA